MDVASAEGVACIGPLPDRARRPQVRLGSQEYLGHAACRSTRGCLRSQCEKDRARRVRTGVRRLFHSNHTPSRICGGAGCTLSSRPPVHYGLSTPVFLREGEGHHRCHRAAVKVCKLRGKPPHDGYHSVKQIDQAIKGEGFGNLEEGFARGRGCRVRASSLVI